MGKKTHYHPISLHVIRGAAEYCGWKFKDINWVAGDIETRAASYVCEIEVMPRAADEWPLKTIKRQLQHCFMDDVTVIGLWCNARGKFFARLFVQIPNDTSLVEEASR